MHHFAQKTEIILDATDANEIYGNAVDKIMESMANFQMMGNNWQLRNVVNLDINRAVYRPLRGNSYIPVPRKLADKKAITNLKNNDNLCFKWCVTRALNPVDKNVERIDKNLQGQAEELNWNEIQFPVSLRDIDKFERRNKGVYVNVFGYDVDKIYPLRHTKQEDAIDLLLVFKNEEKHYRLIKILTDF